MTDKFIIKIVVFLLCCFTCFSEFDIDDRQSCTQFAYNYSKLVADAVDCFAKYAQPFSLCRGCRQSYVNARNFYKKIDDGSFKNADNQSCGASLLYGDRIQVLERLDHNLKEIWSDSKCEKCFGRHNHTRTFFNMHQNLYDCYVKYTDMPMRSLTGQHDDLFPMQRQMYHFNRTACTACLKLYSALNEYFDEIQKDTCMDVTDTMNHTRFEWSELFRCHPQFINAVDIFVPFIVGLVIVVAFYVTARVKKNTVHVRILKQKRMKLVTADSDDYSHGSH